MAERPQDASEPGAEEIHAYLDGLLPPRDAARVEAYLSTHPEAARRLETYRRQDTRLRTTFDPDVGALPEELELLARKLGRTVNRQRRLRGTLRHAAVIALCLAAGVAGRFTADVSPSPEPSPAPAVAYSRHALDAYRLVTAGGEPTSTLDQARVADYADWLGRWYDAGPIHIPRLQALGFEFLGGQVLATGAGPAVQFMYKDPVKGPFSLYVAHRPDCDKSPSGFRRDGDVSLLSWCDGNAVFMLIGRLDRGSMLWIADALAQAQDAATQSGRPQKSQVDGSPEPIQAQPAVATGGATR